MINKVILVGNVGADPEIRTLESGVKVARVRLATTERIFNRQTQEAREHTEWHTLTIWRNLADVADRFVRKGSQIYVEGRIRTNEWTDANGQKRYGTEIMVDELKLLGRKGDNPAAGASAPQQPFSGSGGGYQQNKPAPNPGYGQPTAPAPEAPATSADEIDDLPF